MGERLQEEVQVRARLTGQDPRQAVAHLQRNLDSLREHLTKRRKFLLEQEELTGLVRERMGSAAQLRVPLDVQVGVGPDWDAAAH